MYIIYSIQYYTEKKIEKNSIFELVSATDLIINFYLDHSVEEG